MTTYDTPGPVTLRLSIAAGAIEVRTVDGSQTTVQVDAHGVRPDALSNVREEIRPAAGGGHEVIVEAPRSRGFALGRDASYLVTVSAPHGADLRARTASGEVSAQGRLGEAAVNTASGDVELDEVDGSVSVKTASGDVRVEDAGGDVTVRTVSGDARIGRAGGSAEVAVVSGDVEIGESGPTEVNSVSGDVAVGELTGGDARFRSVSGQMTIGVRSGLRLWLDVSSRSGSTVSELDPEDPAGGSGGVQLELRATSVSGDIRIVRGRSRAATSA